MLKRDVVRARSKTATMLLLVFGVVRFHELYERSLLVSLVGIEVVLLQFRCLITVFCS